MKTKSIIFIIIALIVVGGLVYFFVSQEAVAPGEKYSSVPSSEIPDLTATSSLPERFAFFERLNNTSGPGKGNIRIIERNGSEKLIFTYLDTYNYNDLNYRNHEPTPDETLSHIISFSPHGNYLAIARTSLDSGLGQEYSFGT